jgi:hypothetical protein
MEQRNRVVEVLASSVWTKWSIMSARIAASIAIEAIVAEVPRHRGKPFERLRLGLGGVVPSST